MSPALLSLVCRSLAAVVAAGSCGAAALALVRSEESSLWFGVAFLWAPAVVGPAARAARGARARRDGWAEWFAGVAPAGAFLVLAGWGHAAAEPPVAAALIAAAGTDLPGWAFAGLILSAAGLALDRPPRRSRAGDTDDPDDD